MCLVSPRCLYQAAADVQEHPTTPRAHRHGTNLCHGLKGEKTQVAYSRGKEMGTQVQYSSWKWFIKSSFNHRTQNLPAPWRTPSPAIPVNLTWGKVPPDPKSRSSFKPKPVNMTLCKHKATYHLNINHITLSLALPRVQTQQLQCILSSVR